MDITANNVANVNTNGYKALRPSFGDLMYTKRKLRNDEVDTGHGVRVDKTDLMFGVDSFTAVVNAPEAGILAVGAMKKRAVVLDDDTIAVKNMMWLSLTYDHRIVDGAPAAQFLGRVKKLLEKPALLL